LAIKTKIFNCNIELSFYFFAICSVFLLLDDKLFLINFLVILLHEIGHIVAMFISGAKISKIKVNAFSVDIIQDNCLPYLKEIFIILSGPFLNIILCILTELIYGNLEFELLKSFSVQNLIIGFVNLLPISSLDGGRLLITFLEKYFDENVVYKISCVVSIIFIVPIFCLGFCAVIKCFNFSILILAIYLSSFLIIRN